MLFEKSGTRPEQDLSRLAVHSTKIYDPQDSFKNGASEGEGELFIYTPHGSIQIHCMLFHIQRILQRKFLLFLLIPPYQALPSSI